MEVILRLAHNGQNLSTINKAKQDLRFKLCLASLVLDALYVAKDSASPPLHHGSISFDFDRKFFQLFKSIWMFDN